MWLTAIRVWGTTIFGHRRPLWALLVSCLLLALLALPRAASGNPRLDPDPTGHYRPGVVLVKFKPGTSAAERASALDGSEGTDQAPVRATRLHPVTVPPGRELASVEQLRRNAAVAYAELDYVASVDWAPNDPAYLSGLEWGVTRISASTAWDAARGNNVTIAIIDTGIDLNHPDLAANVIAGHNFVDPTNAPADDNGHGSHVAGIAAAIGNNAIGITGTAPAAKLMPLKALDATGSGYYSNLVLAITYAADHGAKVINMSLGGSNDSQALRDAVDYAWSKGAIVVAAAGNANSSAPFYPAAYSNVVAVAATGTDDSKATFSNYGAYVDVAAPGVSIYSTIPTSNGSYGAMSGTSMATPFVAGLAALVFSAANCSGISNVGVRQAIDSGADDIDASNPSYVGQLGHGRINAWRSLPTPKAITVTTNRLLFLAQAGDLRTQQASVGVDTGICAAPWTSVTNGNGSQTGWLTTTTANTPSPTITIKVDPTGLPAGQYSANVGVSYLTGGVSPEQTIGVQLVIAPQLFRSSLQSIQNGSP